MANSARRLVSRSRQRASISERAGDEIRQRALGLFAIMVVEVAHQRRDRSVPRVRPYPLEADPTLRAERDRGRDTGMPQCVRPTPDPDVRAELPNDPCQAAGVQGALAILAARAARLN